jgi:integrase
MAFVRKVNGKWAVRWKEPKVIVDAGEERRSWRQREKWCPDRATADALAREIEREAALGRNWQEQRARPVVTIARLVRDYVDAAARDPAVPVATARHRAAVLSRFLRFVGEDRLVTDLSVGLLRDYAANLPAEGRAAATRHRKVMEAELLWAWAAEAPETYPGIPAPRRITSTRRPGALRPPPPVVSLADPTWEDVDRMIAHLDQRDWHRRAATLQRYTGARISQVLGLHWSDVDMDARVLTWRAGIPGAKSGATREIPMHSALAEEMAGWGRREGFVFPTYGGEPWRSDGPLHRPFRRAWTLAGVDPAKWGVIEGDTRPGARAHARPTHAIRAAVLAGLLAAGVQESRARYIVGHARGATADAYLSQGRRGQSALWDLLVADVERIPRIGTATSNVVPLPVSASALP